MHVKRFVLVEEVHAFLNGEEALLSYESSSVLDWITLNAKLCDERCSLLPQSIFYYIYSTYGLRGTL